MADPTPIDRYLRKQAPEGSRRVLVLRGYRPYEEVEANWMADQCLRGMRTVVPDLDVADMALSAFRVLGAVTNDPDDAAFNPKDQFPLFLDALAQAEVVLLATHESAGFPDGNLVRLTERLYQGMQQTQVPEAVTAAFGTPKTLGVLVYGGSAAYQAATALSAAWCRFGCSLPKKGLNVYDLHRGDITRANDIGNQLMHTARGLLAGGPKAAAERA